MIRLRLVLGCCAAAVLLCSAAPAQAKWPKRSPSASVLAPQKTPYYGLSTPPPYRWGWFGVEYRTRRTEQHGYYGNYIQYGYWQGYH